MEVRTMALSEFGCPPLPIAGGRRTETDEAVVINSHDLLSAFMAQAFKQQDSEFNRTRKQRQCELEAEYYHRLLTCDDSLDATYRAMGEYTKGYLAAYLRQPYLADDIRVLPCEYISPLLLREINSYHNALHMVLHDTAPDPQERSLEGALRACRALHNSKRRGDSQLNTEEKNTADGSDAAEEQPEKEEKGSTTLEKA